MKTVNIHKAPQRLFVGFRVRLLQDIKTNGGTRYKAGEIMTIKGRWRGEFSLKAEGNKRGFISRVPAGLFVVVS